MKKLVILLIFVFFSTLLAGPLLALDQKVCPCGYNPGGACAPCSEQEETISDPPMMEDNSTFNDVQCECGYSPSGCVPCEDTTLDQQEFEKRKYPE